MTLIHSARVVTPAGVLDPGWVTVVGDQITALGSGRPPRALPPHIDLRQSWLLPGFIDLHVHGGAGAWMTTGHADEVRQAVRFHQQHGTTRTLASLVTAPLDELEHAASKLASLTEDGVIAGIHLEGPFLADAQRGAHDPRHLARPDPVALERLLRAGRATVRVVTLAPELPGAVDLIRRVVAAGAVAAIGHTDATYEQTVAAIDAGARLATHLYNGMRRAHHQDPGPVLAALERPEVVCELIADGVHLHDAIVRLVFAAAGPSRVALITDAIAAAGASDGDYHVGTRVMRVEGGVVRLADGKSLAGSTLTMAAAVRRCALAGLPLTDIAVAAAAVPARVLQIERQVGTIEPGKDADLVALDEAFGIAAVMARGRWIA